MSSRRRAAELHVTKDTFICQKGVQHQVRVALEANLWTSRLVVAGMWSPEHLWSLLLPHLLSPLPPPPLTLFTDPSELLLVEQKVSMMCVCVCVCVCDRGPLLNQHRPRWSVDRLLSPLSVSCRHACRNKKTHFNVTWGLFVGRRRSLPPLLWPPSIPPSCTGTSSPGHILLLESERNCPQFGFQGDFLHFPH